MPKSTQTAQSITTRTRSRKTPTLLETPTVPSPNHDVIAQRAYELFLDGGAMHGQDLEHWLRAESELRAR